MFPEIWKIFLKSFSIFTSVSIKVMTRKKKFERVFEMVVSVKIKLDFGKFRMSTFMIVLFIRMSTERVHGRHVTNLLHSTNHLILLLMHLKVI